MNNVKQTEFLSDDLVDIADPTSMVDGSPLEPQVSVSIGYVPQPMQVSDFLVQSIDFKRLDRDNDADDSIITLIGSFESLQYSVMGSTATITTTAVIGNEDLFHLLSIGLKNLVPMEVKLIDLIGNQAIVAVNAKLVGFSTKEKDRTGNQVQFIFDVSQS